MKSLKSAVTFAVAMLVIGMTTGISHAELLAHWRFEEVMKQDRSRSASVVGESLTGRDNQPVNPRPYSYDESGLGNHLQVWDTRTYRQSTTGCG